MRRFFGRLIIIERYLKLQIQLARPKYGVFNVMCEMCRTENMRNPGRFRLVQARDLTTRLCMSETYCEKCTKSNFDVTDLMLAHSAESRRSIKK